MSDELLIARAAAPWAEIIDTITDDHLDAPTPCSAYDVRKLVNHLVFWAPSLVGAASKELVPPVADSDQDVDLIGDDWAAQLRAVVDRLVEAWGEPAAWDGTTRMGGPTPLPAAMVGGMVLGELIVHGWDLARATAVSPRWDDEVVERTYAEIAKIAEQGREMGVYGAEVPVPDSAPALDRLLGVTGREPTWHR